MDSVGKAMEFLNVSLEGREANQPLSFLQFLSMAAAQPDRMLRNIFQVFHDMVASNIKEGVDEYPDDPESIGFLQYDCNPLLADDADHPFFADPLFATRLVDLVEALKSGAQQNKIYIFQGPAGCGKSTFLNNLLEKFEEYTNTSEGAQYEVVWRIRKDAFPGSNRQAGQLVDRLAHLLGQSEKARQVSAEAHDPTTPRDFEGHFTGEWSFPPAEDEYIEIACPSHDHPFLMIPKKTRREFMARLLAGHELKNVVLEKKEYDWIYRQNPCTICGAMYGALLERLKDVNLVLETIHVRRYRFNRRLGEGISVFNPGDKPTKQNAMSNPMLQAQVDSLFQDSNLVHYIFSRYAKTNNGVYALMDVKSHNTERLIELHNIISEGVHKVDFIEEGVNSLFLAVMNPEDKENIGNLPSFSDRIQYIDVPYVLDYETEVQIYRNVFGHIDAAFLPRVLHNFARVIISTRLEERSPALLEWIGDPEKYNLYCDRNLQLIKMDLYRAHIPSWLTDEDRKALTAQRRRKIIKESNSEGKKGFSGRDSIHIFGDFYSKYHKDASLITMANLVQFFSKTKSELTEHIPSGFLESLTRMYNYLVLQEVKESLYYYNESQISRDIQHYLFSLNFEPGTEEKCPFTGERVAITEDFWVAVEYRLLGSDGLDSERRRSFRSGVQKEYASVALAQEVMVEGRPLTETKLFHSLHERYVHNLKQRVLDPFLKNENFRRAIMDYGMENYKTYDQRIREDVSYLLKNLEDRFGYTPKGAREVCVYVIDQELADKFK
jgi:energy-coupling factor transporter ATP-binding protein EcfA2